MRIAADRDILLREEAIASCFHPSPDVHAFALRAILAALALVIAVPANASGASRLPNGQPFAWSPPPATSPGVTFVPLINAGSSLDGTTFEGIPDGIGVRPGPQGER